MRYLLDSDTLSDLLAVTAPNHPAVTRRLASLAQSDSVVFSILALYELEYGFANAPEPMKPLLRHRILSAQSAFGILSLTPAAATIFGRLKAGLRTTRGLSERGSRAHNIDLMVAATAIIEGCVLVSGDSLYSELQRLEPELHLQDWSS